MPKGSIKSWRRDRGFGFINVDDQDEDVFVHISELRSLGRQPRVGDRISFTIEEQDNGKVRAIKCKVKNQSAQSDENTASNKTAIAISVVVAAIFAALAIYYLSAK